MEFGDNSQLNYFMLPTDSVGLDLGDSTQLLFAYGDSSSLDDLTHDNTALNQAIAMRREITLH